MILPSIYVISIILSKTITCATFLSERKSEDIVQNLRVRCIILKLQDQASLVASGHHTSKYRLKPILPF